VVARQSATKAAVRASQSPNTRSRVWQRKERLAILLPRTWESANTRLYRNYKKLLDRGHALRSGTLRMRQFQVAMGGNPSMLIWLGKNFLKQKDRVEQTGQLDPLRELVVSMTAMSRQIGPPEGMLTPAQLADGGEVEDSDEESATLPKAQQEHSGRNLRSVEAKDGLNGLNSLN
jgi:hypothetical protein